MITLAALVTWLWFGKVRYFDPDEFEHLHFAWCVSKGMLPYRDFFEHHTPWFHYAIAFLMPSYQVDRRFDDTLAFICLARRIDVMLAAIALALTFMLARRWRGSASGWIAIAMLAVTPVFARKTLEIRPDVLALVLWLGCLVALVHALSAAALSARRRAMLFALSGLLLGGAIMSSQKLLMVMPGFALAMLWYVADGRRPRLTRARDVGLQAAGFGVPILATLGYFWSRRALGPFVYFNLILNLHWKASEYSPFFLLNHGFAENPSLLMFGGLGLILEAFRESRQRAFSAGKLLILSAAALIAGLWEMPVAQEQYYLTFLPLLAIFAARFLIGVAEAVSGEYAALSPGGLRYVIAIAFLTGTIAILLTRPDRIWAHPDTRWMKVSVVLLLFAGTALMFRSRNSAAALAVLLCAVCLCPYYLARVRFLDVNTSELRSLQYVIEQTSPTDTMMDGFSGIGVFRPHAYFYWLLNPEIVGMMTDEQKRRLLADFQAGKIAPRYIILDYFLAHVLFPLRWYVWDNYRVVPGQPMICQRLPLSP
jgi:hypothetical protein